MTDEDQAAAYLKLQDNVQELIVKTVYNELLNNPHGMLASRLVTMAVDAVDSNFKYYRLTKVGHTAPY